MLTVETIIEYHQSIESFQTELLSTNLLILKQRPLYDEMIEHHVVNESLLKMFASAILPSSKQISVIHDMLEDHIRDRFF